MSNNLSDTEFMVHADGIIEVKYPDSSFGVHELAREMGYSREYLSRRFSPLFGLPPSEYIFKKRISKAAELLCNAPDMSIIQIALDSGFGGPAYFSKCFKAHFAMTPSEWRAGCSGNGH